MTWLFLGLTYATYLVFASALGFFLVIGIAIGVSLASEPTWISKLFGIVIMVGSLSVTAMGLLVLLYHMRTDHR